MPVHVLANESTAAFRRVYFHMVDATDGITPETGEAGEQPQIATNGGAFTDTGIGVLTHLGNGRYYADVTQAAVATAGLSIETRFKSANTAETPGDSIRVVAFDPNDAVSLGLTAMPTDEASQTASKADVSALALEATVDAVGVIVAAIQAVTDVLPNAGALTNISASTDRLTEERAAVLTDWINGGRLDLLLDSIETVTDKFAFTVANQVDANALTGGGGGTPAEIAAAVWDALKVAHVIVGSFGSLLDTKVSIGAGGAGTGNTIVTAQTNHGLPNPNGLRAVQGGVGVDEVIIKFYLTSDYDGDVFAVRATAVTNSLGDFVAAVNLDSGLTYTAVYTRSGYNISTKEFTVS